MVEKKHFFSNVREIFILYYEKNLFFFKYKVNICLLVETNHFLRKVREIKGSDVIRGLALENGKCIVQTLRKIGKLNFVKLYFKKFSVVKLVTAHIFSIYNFFYKSV